VGDYLAPGLVTLGIIVLVLVLMALGWRNRRRRQSSLEPLVEPPAELGVVALRDDVLYLATTAADRPLDRIAVQGLGYRANARVTVASSGVLLELVGERPVFVPATAITGVGLATWTVDRVVERDGLVFVRWVLGDTALDSYLRSSDPSALVAAIAPLASAPVRDSTSAPDSTPDESDAP
jgi:hypothetical protein